MHPKSIELQSGPHHDWRAYLNAFYDCNVPAEMPVGNRIKIVGPERHKTVNRILTVIDLTVTRLRSNWAGLYFLKVEITTFINRIGIWIWSKDFYSMEIMSLMLALLMCTIRKLSCASLVTKRKCFPENHNIVDNYFWFRTQIKLSF